MLERNNSTIAQNCAHITDCIILAVRTDNDQESKGVDRFSLRNTNTMVSNPSRWCLHGECMRVEISAYIDANLHPSD